MKDENKIVEILAEMLLRADKQEELLEKLVEGQGKLVEAQAKTNLAIGELRLSNMRIAEALEKFGDHETRIQKIEQTLFRKAG